MSKTFKLISLGVLTTLALSTTNVNADCIGSGFGVGVTLSATQNKITFNDKNIKKAYDDARNGLKEKLKAAIAATQKKFDKPNDKNTPLVEDDNPPRKVNGYTDPTKLADGSNNNDAENLPKNPVELTFKTKKFNSENPTKYRILTIDQTDPIQSKYNDKGMVDKDNGSYLPKQPILVQPLFLKDNNFKDLNAPIGSGTNPVVIEPNTNVAGNYATITQTVNSSDTGYYIAPREFDFLDEINLDENEFADEKNWPTHAKWDDIFTDNANDKITKQFLNDILNNNDLKSEHRKQFTGDEWFEYDGLGGGGSDKGYYINTVKHKDLGITDSIRDSAISTLAPSKTISNTFKDVSKWSFDLGFNIFYQYRIFDWFIRAGLFGNFPIANRTISLLSNSNNNDNKDSKDKKSSSNDLSLTHSFDIGAQILFGYNVTQTFALVFGGEIGYSKYKLNNLNQLTSGYNMDSDKLVNWLAAGSSKEEVLKEYNNTFKDYGLSDKEKSFNKWFWRFVAGCEFNFGKCIVGLHGFFGPNTSLMNSKNNKDFGDLKVVNGGVRATVAFKF